MDILRFIFFLAWACQSALAVAGEADVIQAEARETTPRTLEFRVTVAHSDEGWDHYADRWEIVAPDGSVLETRVLHHPHVDEQPFTRSLSSNRIPDAVESVTVRAHDSVHGYGGRQITLRVPR